MVEKILYKDLSYKIYGYCFKAHNDLGRFRNEQIYGDYIEQLLKEDKVGYKRESPLSIAFENEKIGRIFPISLLKTKLSLI